MFEAYRIGIRLSLVNNVSAGVLALAGHFTKLSGQVGAAQAGVVGLQKKLEGLKNLGMVGGVMAGAGAFGLSLFKGPIERAIEYEREIGKMKQMGLGEAQIADAQKFVTATAIIGTSIQQRMRLFAEAQGAFRESGMDGDHALSAAKSMMPVLANYETASKLLSGPHASAVEGAMRSLNKTVEIMGGITDPKRAVEIADAVFKAVQSSGKMVNEQQLKNFVAYGSSATNSIDVRAIMGGLEPIIGEFGGSTVGTGLRTAFTRMSGAMSMPPKKMQGILSELGIGKLDHGSVRLNDTLLPLMQRDPIEFARQMMEVYAQHGITSVLDRERANAQLFTTNGAKIYNKIMAQMPVIEESLKSYDRAHGATQTIADNKDSPMLAEERYEAAVKDLHLALGQTVLPLFTRGVIALSKALEGGLEFARQYPLLFKTLVYGFGALAAAMAIGGTIAVLVAGFKGLGLVMSLGKGVGGMLGGVATGLGLIGKASLALAALWAVYKIAELGKAAYDLYQVKTREGVKLTPEAYQRVVNGETGVKVIGSETQRQYWASIGMPMPGINAPWPSAKTADAVPVLAKNAAAPVMLPNVLRGGNSVVYKPADMQPVLAKNAAARAPDPAKPSDSRFVATKTQQTVQVSTQINLDGRKVGEAISAHQAREAGRALAGATGFDNSQFLAPVGLR